jgi:hypothetical protein
MAENQFRWHTSFHDLKTDCDLEFGQVGEVDEAEKMIVYRPRNGGVPTLFCCRYEAVNGRYRLTGDINVFELRRKER